MSKNKSVFNVISDYSWLLAVLIVFLVAAFAVNSQPSIQQPSACYIITPGVSCTQSILLSNSSSSTLMLVLTNQLGTNITFSSQSILSRPNLTSDYSIGKCTPSQASPGATILCRVKFSNYLEPLGSELNPTFNVVYNKCIKSACDSEVNTSGFATVTAQKYSNFIYFIRLNVIPANSSDILFQNISHTSGSVVGAIGGVSYDINISPSAHESFAGWSSNYNITISNPKSPQTTLTVSGNGTITAKFNEISTTITSIPTTLKSTVYTSLPMKTSTRQTSYSTTSTILTTPTISSTSITLTITSFSTTSSSTSISTSTSTTLSTTSTTSSSTSTSTTSSSTSTSTTSSSTSTSTTLSTTSTTSSTTVATVKITISITKSSFVGHTQVLLANNTYQYIQNMHPGEAVLSYNTKTGKFYTNTVVKVINFTVIGEYKINNLIGTDSGEVFYTSSGTWVHPNDLKIGDKILNPITNSWINVTSVAYLPEEITVYDVIGSSGNNFIVDGGYLADSTTL